jgi:hypothetical protein
VLDGPVCSTCKTGTASTERNTSVGRRLHAACAEGGDAAIPLKARQNRAPARTGEVARRPRATAGGWGRGPPCSDSPLLISPERHSSASTKTLGAPAMDRPAGAAAVSRPVSGTRARNPSGPPLPAIAAAKAAAGCLPRPSEPAHVAGAERARRGEPDLPPSPARGSRGATREPRSGRFTC